MKKEKKAKSIGTHNGRFHADEVTACALLVMYDLADRNQIIRTRDPELLACCEYVLDVGGVYAPESKLFDHHQASYKGELASAGMILKFLLDTHVIDQKEFNLFHDSFLWGVDQHDLGLLEPQKGVCSFSILISSFLPITYDASSEEEDQTFFQALDFVIAYLKRLKARYSYNLSCKQLVKAAMETKNNYLVLEQAVPWIESFFEMGGQEHPALFLLMPAGEHWKLRAIPPTLEQRMGVRKALPKKWAGLLDEDLKKESQIPGAIFCHKGGFISMWETFDDAKQALEQVLKQGDEK